LDGRDDNWDEPAFRQRRAFSFETTITELSLQFEYSPFAGNEWVDSDGKFIKKISPYGFAGIGVAFWDPTTDYNIGADGAAPFGTSIARIDADRDSDFGTTAFTIPIGAGVKYDITEKIIGGLEFGIRIPFTDYLDGVSIAANPDRDDWYWFAGATVAQIETMICWRIKMIDVQMSQALYMAAQIQMEMVSLISKITAPMKKDSW